LRESEVSSVLLFPQKKQRGIATIYVALSLVVFLGVMGLVVDIGFLYWRRAEAQKAADAAALAGAMKLPDTSLALSAAQSYAAQNGYNVSVSGVTVTGQANPDGAHPNWYRVSVNRPERLFFGSVFRMFSTPIGATATAEFLSKEPINVWGVGTYGTVGTQSLEISGPYARYSYGDPYATKYLDSGASNPLYDPNGYNYNLYIPPNYSTINGTTNVMLELYDATSGTSSSSWSDEVYSSHGVSTQATTVFTIYRPDSTPNDYTDDVVIATATIGPSNSTYKLKWAVPPGFSFDSATYGTGNYRINVKTTSGTGGNAYHMRAGPPRGSGQSFNPNNGTSLSGVGRLQMFFQADGTVTWNLGYIPPEAAGTTLHIKKFDTDIGAQSITYTDTSGYINFTGMLSTNGTWKEDVYTIPSNYPGGTLRAIYTAGRTDTSVWEMWYEGVLAGQPGLVRLVQ
jgi:hypothetical protein